MFAVCQKRRGAEVTWFVDCLSLVLLQKLSYANSKWVVPKSMGAVLKGLTLAGGSTRFVKDGWCLMQGSTASVLVALVRVAPPLHEHEIMA